MIIFLEFNSWVKDNKLDQLEFARQKQTYCYFSAAATLFSPQMSDARISWAKNSILTTVVDDFFDIGGSTEELHDLISLVEKFVMWDANWEKETHSEQWLGLMKSMMQEADWLLTKKVPSLDEYMKNEFVSFALGPTILLALYFVGPELRESAVKHT
ncbi:hypothetical protein ZIOFF_027333 [Zingiber officinale]|uniref:Terpene synthase metal-binding domain-containing protein n=1 Tax=Zingiber officinale TaxID=94328 RepID=A0A8J5GQ60_ZINOF|nr:hypothetical protein ZIOFF_027333 [Zingiber officinale]